MFNKTSIKFYMKLLHEINFWSCSNFLDIHTFFKASFYNYSLRNQIWLIIWNTSPKRASYIFQVIFSSIKRLQQVVYCYIWKFNPETWKYWLDFQPNYSYLTERRYFSSSIGNSSGGGCTIKMPFEINVQ